MVDPTKAMTDKDMRMVAQIKQISAKGKNAEVKQDRNGDWIIYEVDKKKKVY